METEQEGASCVCRPGYSGTGELCTLVPSRLSLRGYSHPTTAQIEVVPSY